MRKIIVLTFISLDGVMQGPGGPTEDTSGNFTYGGWTVPFFDDFLGQTMTEQMSRQFDLLLGRKTFEIFASYWPQQEGGENPINEATKYVASNTLTKHEWNKSVFLKGDVVEEIKKLKHKMVLNYKCMVVAISFRRYWRMIWSMNFGSRYFL